MVGINQENYGFQIFYTFNNHHKMAYIKYKLENICTAALTL